MLIRKGLALVFMKTVEKQSPMRIGMMNLFSAVSTVRSISPFF